jgi:4-hydroxyphenylpyruvate dioxygenase
METLAETKFSGPLSLEIFSDPFLAGSARSVAVDGHRLLIALMDEVSRRTGPLLAGTALPPRALVYGTSVIEFARDETSAPAFEGVLAGLGVRKAIGPGELEIPAVRAVHGVRGSLTDFIDGKTDLARVWDIEFRAVETVKRPEEDAGLHAVDHISQSMHHEQMLNWSLFSTSLLDVEKVAEQDVLDPGSVVKSLAVQTSSGLLRLPLNAPQLGCTQSSRFLLEARGSGGPHIAFATRDIFATARRRAENGVAMLVIPEHDYGDLESKTDLSADEIDRLKAHNMLDERDVTGENVQLYTRTFEDRFFFEIVERRGGYKGFGATNAQIRLAAQARQERLAAIRRR